MDELALFGGKPIRDRPYSPNITTDTEEEKAVIEVLKKGILSEFEGTNNEYFLGGEQIKKLESEWAEKFGVKHAIAVNSATSGLFAAMGAIGVGPGDEVITTPFTMTATASSILANNAVPVFADVELDTFNIDPASIKRVITENTRAILVVHIFGHPAEMGEIQKIANEHNLFIVEDAAQSPLALYKGKLTGTIGDIGIYSLNCNKAIQCGEGGIVVTNNDELALRLRLIRNHAEAVIASGMKVNSLVNMIGWNYRMTEVEAAIARCQLKKLDGLTKKRLELVEYLNEKISRIPGLFIPVVKEGCTHVYYRYAAKLDKSSIPILAEDFVRALNAEGMDFYVGYMKPLYLQPLYQNQIGFGNKGCPFKCPWYKGKTNYVKGICRNAEQLEEFLISTEVVRSPQTFKDMDEIYQAIKKVIDNMGDIQKRSK